MVPVVVVVESSLVQFEQKKRGRNKERRKQKKRQIDEKHNFMHLIHDTIARRGIEWQTFVAEFRQGVDRA